MYYFPAAKKLVSWPVTLLLKQIQLFSKIAQKKENIIHVQTCKEDISPGPHWEKQLSYAFLQILQTLPQMIIHSQTETSKYLILHSDPKDI